MFSKMGVFQVTVGVLIAACSLRAEVPVPFLSFPPVIDGVLDAKVRRVPARAFAHVAGDADMQAKPALTPSYRVAYGANFLYVYVEIGGADIATRDRAYQNGDGIQLALTVPRANDAPTDEFYVMGFTVAPNRPDSRQNKFVWYRNVDLSFAPLKGAVLAAKTAGGKTGIELLLPWTDVYPYHPWMSETVGFNLRYVKAVGETDKIEYSVVDDNRLDSEQSLRRYTRLRFEPPAADRTPRAYAVLAANHITQGEAAKAKVAINARTADTLRVRASIVSGEGTRLDVTSVEIPVGRGLSIRQSDLPTRDLPPGDYLVRLAASGLGDESFELTILPSYEPQQLKSGLEAVQARIKPGSVHTLEFQQEEIASAARKLRPYDIATELRLLLARHLECLGAAERGQDAIAQRSGVTRRAYRSKVDGTLQPYSVRIPERLEAAKLYPVIVYLHGSGEDDRGALREGFLPDDFIQVAPRGRGTSNAYSSDHAQDDISEVIDDVLANYPADPKRIILSGFSMGGYGVYRTFYQSPRRYRALAVFSGHPDIARHYIGGDHPNFLNTAFLKDFRGMPVFIFHGGRDRNCPIELTRELVGKLRDAGAQVEFHYENDKGHEAPSPETMKAFAVWLDRIAARP